MGSNPVLLYHGTDTAFSKFRMSDSGFYGGGIYFTDNLEAAIQYADDKGGDDSFVLSAHVVMKEPYVFEADVAFTETTAESLIRRLFKGDKKRRVLNTFEEQGALTNEIRDALTSRGHDGLIVRVPFEPDEYIAYDPEQVKIVQLNVLNEGYANITREKMRA